MYIPVSERFFGSYEGLIVSGIFFSDRENRNSAYAKVAESHNIIDEKAENLIG